jgi:hypothetical protein
MNNESTIYHYAYIQNTWFKSHGMMVTIHFLFMYFGLKIKKTNKKREGNVVQEIRKFLPFFTLHSLKK